MAIAVRTWPARLLARPWLLAFVPVNAATAGFGVLLPLVILIPLRGSWADVATAATVFNVAVIASSIAWGHLADRVRVRRPFLLATYGGYALLYFAIPQIHSLPALYLVYGIVGLVAPAATSASNLLILEQFSAGERATAFASFQEMTMVGSVAGLLVGFFWTGAGLALLPLDYVLAALAAASAVGLWIGIRESARTLSTRHVAQHPESLVSRLKVSTSFHIAIPFFPRRPRLRRGAWARFRLWAREEIHHELPLLLAGIFLFNLSANLFNISYTPYLYAIGLGAAAIFLVNFSNSVAQTLLFPLSGTLSNRIGPDRLVRLSTYVRSLGYLATAGFTFVAVLGPGAFTGNVIVYGVLGGAIALYTTSSSLILFRGLEGRDAGGVLGINSALGGGAAVLGAALSGVLALFGSYRLVFLVAAGALLVSIPIWSAASVAWRRRVEGRPTVAVVAPPDAEPEPSARPDAGLATKTH